MVMSILSNDQQYEETEPMILAKLEESRNHKRCKDLETLLQKPQAHARVADIPFIDENTSPIDKS
ncbi:hypothetical protein T10_9972 [Trichinella papuae]|uniref:Uncharacterized protein n=1 Tax=Trichinella papuae TaxID=268474 RepID=A0A0V1ML48_9BILA|nr:hypothetical protein T10_9972 [Trichinella papuae]